MATVKVMSTDFFFVENEAQLWRGLCYFIAALKFYSTEGNLHVNQYSAE